MPSKPSNLSGSSAHDEALDLKSCICTPLFVPTVSGVEGFAAESAAIDQGNDSYPTIASLRRSTSMRSSVFSQPRMVTNLAKKEGKSQRTALYSKKGKMRLAVDTDALRHR